MRQWLNSISLVPFPNNTAFQFEVLAFRVMFLKVIFCFPVRLTTVPVTGRNNTLSAFPAREVIVMR